MTQPALQLDDVTVIRDGNTLVGPVSWTVQPDERWVLLGPNGCGKSTLMRVASMHMHPTTGRVELLGNELGKSDVRKLRPKVGYSSASLADSFRATITVRDAVMTAKNGALEPWWHEYDDADRDRAVELLDRFGCKAMAERSFNTLSSGERQRVLLARTLMTEPAIVMLDEPTAALDLGGREGLVADLDTLASDPTGPALALVTHHVEEIPPSFTHLLLMRYGGVIAQGPIGEHLTEANLSAAFGLPLDLEQRSGRWAAFASSDDPTHLNRPA